jgi:transcriptional regulator of acetoin/glycerol metabolism
VREFRNAVESMLLTAPGSVITEGDLPPELLQMAQVATQPSAVDGDSHARDLTRLEAAEREALIGAMRQCLGNLTAVARHLGIAKSTVYLKLKRFGLESLVDELRAQSALS